MNRISILLLFFSFCYSFALSAQESVVIDQLNSECIMQQLIGEEYVEPGFTKKGVYFRDNFLTGNIIVFSKDTVYNVKIRYNYSTDQVIWLSVPFGQVQLDKNSILGFELKNADTIFRFNLLCLQPLIDHNKHFYQICYQGKIQLLVQKRSVVLTNYIKNGRSYSLYKPDFKYYLNVGGSYHLIKKLSAKEIYKLFPTKKLLIKNALKNSNSRIKKESDFVELLGKIENILLS